MTIRLSQGTRDRLAMGLGLGAIFNRGSIEIYTGAQPATADAAVTGTLLGVVTVGSGALTKETRATGTITITGGSTSVATVTVGGFNIIPDGAVAYNTSVNQTASDLCDAINRNGIFEASVSGATVTITPRPGAGDAFNAAAVTSTGSVTATYGNMAGGVDNANGLTLINGAAGVVQKLSTQTWSFNGLANGTAGWFRLVQSAADAGAALSAAPWIPRIDGSVAVSGSDMRLSNIVIATGAPCTIDTFKLTMPAQ